MKHEIGQEVWALTGNKIYRGKVTGADIIDGGQRYSIDAVFGYFYPMDIFNTKLEALEAWYKMVNRIDRDKAVPEWK